MLTPEHRKEALSRAYIQAVAGQVGLTCSVRDFDYGIDLTVHRVIERTSPATGRKRYIETGLRLDIQAKSTTRVILEGDYLKYDLDVDNYNDLRDPEALTPRILVLHVLPEGDNAYLQQTENALCLLGCCYWVSLKGAPAVRNKATRRVAVPRDNVFSEWGLRVILNRIERGEDL